MLDPITSTFSTQFSQSGGWQFQFRRNAYERLDFSLRCGSDIYCSAARHFLRTLAARFLSILLRALYGHAAAQSEPQFHGRLNVGFQCRGMLGSHLQRKSANRPLYLTARPLGHVQVHRAHRSTRTVFSSNAVCQTVRKRSKPSSMELKSQPLLAFLGDPRRRLPRALSLQGGGIAARGGKRANIGFEEVVAKPATKRGMLSSSFSLDLAGGKQIILPAVSKAAANSFAEAVGQAWSKFNLRELAKEEERIQRLLQSLEKLQAPERYPSAFHIDPLAREALDLTDRVLSKLNAEAVGDKTMRRIAPILSFSADPAKAREAAIERFVDAQLDRWTEFLDTVESMPLTPEQRLSVVVDEDATLVLAGAGSGKTSVITAKAAYLVKAGIRSPEELLLLAFARDAATEMSERIEARCGVPIAARTFHALAYEIIGDVEGEKPALAPTATDDKAFLSLIRDILRYIVSRVSDVAETVIGWFAGFFDDFPSPWDFKSAHEWYSEVESRNLRTLQGETVNSFEELIIANWLYRNGIAYEYEPTYEHKLTGTGRRVYTPDFRLTESGVYIEHFGVRKRRASDGTEQLTTAPFVDRDEYLASMDWKRKVHTEHETVLIETYSWEREEGRLLDALAQKLAPHVTLRPIPDIEIYDQVTLDLSRFRAAPIAHLGGLSFESQWAFPTER